MVFRIHVCFPYPGCNTLSIPSTGVRFKMTLQRTCHAQAALPVFCIFGLLASARPVLSEQVANDYPTYARVEYVNDCVVRSGKLASLYQCSCAIDRIAQRLSYESFVEASTFAKYSG